MELSSKRRNRIFWLLQFGGWGTMHLFPMLVMKEVSSEFLVFNFVAGTLIAVVATTPLRYYLRKHIQFNSFGWKEVARIGVAILMGSLFLALGSFLVGFLYAKLVPVEDPFVEMVLKTYNSFWLLVVNSIFLVFIWVACYLVIKLLLKLNSSRLERLELNANLKQARLDTLKGQINPHFMFNSLNNIRGLMLEDVESARDMLTKLSEMLRYSLTRSDTDAIRLEEELEMVDHYIDLSKIQFEDRLNYTREIQPGTLAVPIPPMIVQLLVENAVKHGIANSKEGGNVLVLCRLDDPFLVIEVRNTGTLRLSPGSTQLGLKNIRQRLRLLFGDRASFSLKQEGEEVLAQIKIPTQ